MAHAYIPCCHTDSKPYCRRVGVYMCEVLVNVHRIFRIRLCGLLCPDCVPTFTGGRQDLVDKEEAELKVMVSYLPTQLSAEEVQKAVEQVSGWLCLPC